MLDVELEDVDVTRVRDFVREHPPGARLRLEPMGAEAISEVERRFDARNCAVGANFFHVKLNSLSKTPRHEITGRHPTITIGSIKHKVGRKWLRKYGVM